MPLTANALPSQPSNFTLPVDANMQFASAQTLAASGFVNNLNAVVDLGPGRIQSMLALNISAMDVSSGNETYQLALIGSNDIAFGNGNCDLLAFHDFAAAAAGRIIATLLAASPAIPPTGLAGSILALPFTNLMQGIIYRYAKLDAILAGTTPSITLSAWIVPAALV